MLEERVAKLCPGASAAGVTALRLRMLALGTTPALLPRRHLGLPGQSAPLQPMPQPAPPDGSKGRIELYDWARIALSGTFPSKQGLGIAGSPDHVRSPQRPGSGNAYYLVFQSRRSTTLARSYVAERRLLALALNLEPSRNASKPTRDSFDSSARSRSLREARSWHGVEVHPAGYERDRIMAGVPPSLATTRTADIAVRHPHPAYDGWKRVPMA